MYHCRKYSFLHILFLRDVCEHLQDAPFLFFPSQAFPVSLTGFWKYPPSRLQQFEKRLPGICRLCRFLFWFRNFRHIGRTDWHAGRILKLLRFRFFNRFLFGFGISGILVERIGMLEEYLNFSFFFWFAALFFAHFIQRK